MRGNEMATKKLRFNCYYCKKTITLDLDDAFQEKFRKNADYWPYPLIIPHEEHFAIVFLDEDFVERGVNVTRMIFE